MNKKAILIVVGAVFIVACVVIYFIGGIKVREKPSAVDEFVEVSDPISEINKNPIEPVVDEPVKVSGEIISDKKLNGFIFFGENKIEVKNSEFSSSQTPRGTFETEFVDSENNYFFVEPSIVQIFTATELKLELVN